MQQRRILAWADDPLNDDMLETDAPDLSVGLLPVKISGRAPKPDIYPVGEGNFRWWNAADALRRARNAWSAVIPAQTRWMTGRYLTVLLDEGDDLNAYYNRRTLSFFHSTVEGITVYSGESPDIVAHEFGHAVLDALQPALFDAMGIEAAAFHESFGDISALLAALQVPDVRAELISHTDGNLHRASRVSRIAEQLGWAVRQRHPGGAEHDCLRNAANVHYYRDPNYLPTSGPAAALTSQPHSFSRIFTGAFLELLNGVYRTVGGNSPDAGLVEAAQWVSQLLVDAVLSAPIVPEYFSQVAAAMIRADSQRNQGQFGHVLRSAFTRRGILSVQSATGLTGAPAATPHALGMAETAAVPTRASVAATVKELPFQAFGGAQFGLEVPALLVRSPDQPRTLAASPAALNSGSIDPPSAQVSARAFLEDLYRYGRIDTSGHESASTLVHPFTKKTHELRQEGNSLFVGRRVFDCGFDPIS